MERPDVIPYTWQGLTKTLKLYEEYADNLEAALARERESVNELSLANQKLEAEVKDIKALTLTRGDMIRFLKDQNQDLNQACIKRKAQVKKLKDLIREAAPLEWVMDFEMEEPEEWEERAKKALEG